MEKKHKTNFKIHGALIFYIRKNIRQKREEEETGYCAIFFEFYFILLLAFGTRIFTIYHAAQLLCL
jgi:membrane-anchored glycerophosphoryl diester phosphodiesterase (GDPDase)